ncbi:metallophosphatase domain-containing protein [Aspergillus saccharolyticus JOP 1030-1]|uniref:Ser/Thr protein phosphatase family protein n=1 Tax=Aspergillus saccharolyticus JOP 1030-1 TaxID=1450539 RepID=A0A318ZHM2_9EURO|nr:Ser/Thr protein phosphatase family protein [Aspergillus saccharolyticus JOP 1030-1]PYH43190.1 Ser/Thr protein phosphatase family protein [Aspergillus saccharolyticus JOP 1030-1]
MRRSTRFVCVSDTHAYTPSEAGFKLPAGDVLIHAGDLTNHGSMAELRRTMDWISAADFEVKIIVCGNHDVTLDAEFYARHGSKFHGQHLEDPQKCIELVTEASKSSIAFLRHESALVRLNRPNGPNTVFKVFGSPYSQSSGTWAYGYDSSEAARLWSSIPLDSDIVVTHTPPHSHCDRHEAAGVSVGCEALRQVLSNVRPMLAVCGHVHESRGYERVQWLPSSTPSHLASTTHGRASQTIQGVLPPRESKKQSLVDLTGKRSPKLDNDGFFAEQVATSFRTVFQPRQKVKLTPLPDPSLPGGLHSHRRETCIINAAVMATSWPHRGGKRFNTPIVVDLDLPTGRGF